MKKNKKKNENSKVLKDVKIPGLKLTELPKVTITAGVDIAKLTEKFGVVATANSERIHVIHVEEGWAVNREGERVAIAVEATRDSAIKAASAIVSAKKIIVHKKDGTIFSNKTIK